MSRLPLLFLLLASGIQASNPNFFSGIVKANPNETLQHHMDVFHLAALTNNKEKLKLMMPLDQRNENLLDILMLRQRSVQSMQVRDAQNVEEGTNGVISGMVDYTMESGSTKVMNVIIEQAPESPSGYKFVTVIEHPDQVQKRNFPVCLVGFIWCYMYLIGFFPGTVEQVFNGWST